VNSALTSHFETSVVPLSPSILVFLLEAKAGARLCLGIE
jgi:hypothetical protein